MKKKDRCPKWSMAWNIQCELKKDHAGMCDNAGDGFFGRDPSEEKDQYNQNIIANNAQAALRSFEKVFQDKLQTHQPKRRHWEGRLMDDAEMDEEAIREMRAEYMASVALALSFGSNHSRAVGELALFESWVKARQ